MPKLSPQGFFLAQKLVQNDKKHPRLVILNEVKNLKCALGELCLKSDTSFITKTLHLRNHDRDSSSPKSSFRMTNKRGRQVQNYKKHPRHVILNAVKNLTCGLGESRLNYLYPISPTQTPQGFFLAQKLVQNDKQKGATGSELQKTPTACHSERSEESQVWGNHD